MYMVIHVQGCAAPAGFEVRAWGSHKQGQLGIGEVGGEALVPAKVALPVM